MSNVVCVRLEVETVTGRIVGGTLPLNVSGSGVEIAKLRNTVARILRDIERSVYE